MNALERKRELLNAVKGGDLQRLNSLLQEGGDINAIHPNGKTLLIVAIEAQHREIVEFLIQAGAKLNQGDFYDRTPLMYAADKADVSIARLLLESRADVDARNRQGRTALMYAAYNDSVEMTETLLNAGADINARDHKDRSALDYSAFKLSRAYAPKTSQLLSSRHAEVKQPQGDTSSLGFVQDILSIDEFTELRRYKSWGCSSVFAAYFALFFLFCFQFLFGPFTILFIIGCARILLGAFPSIIKIFSLRHEILQGRSRPATFAKPASPRSHQDTDDNLAFVSQLMDLGSRELATIHIKDLDSQRLPTKVSILKSRKISVLLAVSIFLLIVILLLPGFSIPKPQEVNLDAPFSALSLRIWAILPIWMLVVNKLEYRLRLKRLKLVQQDRDRIAGEISKLLNADDFREKELPQDFGLYLRAFMTTDKLHIKGFDLETILAYSIGTTLPLLALGKPGEHLGSGRIQTSDEHWREEILRLMDAARLILIIPSYRAGTLWEIATLRERGYFEKTIFIMPPELEFHGGKYSEDWQKTVIAAQGYGVEFPNHIPIGTFFRLNSDGEFEAFAPFVPDQFIQEFDPGGGGGDSSDASSSDGAADGSNGMDALNADSGMDGDGGEGSFAADGVDGGFGGDGGGDGGGGDGGGGY